jgi:hypothetical protein
MGEPVLSGDITAEGVLPLLATIEKRRTSGVLRFESSSGSGEVVLVAGQLAEEQPEIGTGDDPVEVLLGLTDGTYIVEQRLPMLPVSKGDDHHREGSLSVHVPADLMNYCERAGLTGILGLERDDRKAEIVYDRGELIAIRVDGSADDDLHDVFSWEDGTFSIGAFSEAPPIQVDLAELEPFEEDDPSEREPTMKLRRRREDGASFLKVVEVALSTILEEREKRRSPTRTSPPLPPPMSTRRPESVPPRADSRPRKDPTVKVIYLGEPDEAAARGDRGIRHVHGRAAGEGTLPDAAPDRRPKPSEGASSETAAVAPSTAATVPSPPWRGIGSALGWMLVLVVLFFLALFILSNLPPL